MNRAAGDPKGGPLQSFAIHLPLWPHTPLYIPFHVGCGAGGRGRAQEGEEKREMPTFSGQLRSRLSPLLPPRRRPLQSPPGRSARRQRRASVAFPSPPPGPPLQASPELSVAQTSPPGPARPSPRAPQTLSNPLGSRRLLGEETLAAAEAGATRLRAGRRRGARYGEPSNEARAGAQRRRVLAEHGRGAAAAAVAAGAQGPLHHWQPWSPSIFLPQGRRLGSAHVLGEEGAGARASPEGGGTCARAEGATLSCPLPPQPALPHPAAPATGREGAAAAAPFSAALVARRAGAATAADAVQRNERASTVGHAWNPSTLEGRDRPIT